MIPTTDEADVKQREFSLDETLLFPDDITSHELDGMILVISAKKASWLVLTQREFVFFSYLKSGKTLGQALFALEKKFADGVSDTPTIVLAQIEERQFYRGAKTVELQIAKNATLSLTHGCNLRCTTCYMEATNPTNDECTPDVWKSFLRQFRDLGGETVTFTGGEPLSYKNAVDLLRFSKEIGLQVTLLTNGTLITIKNAAAIGELCDEIQISIDGPDAETHDSIRGKGRFNRTLDAIKLLAPFRSRISIAMTPTSETLPAFKQKLKRFVSWIRCEIREDIMFRVTPILMEGRNVCRLGESAETVFYDEVNRLSSEAIEEGAFQKADSAALIPNRLLSSCGFGVSLSILWNGNVGGCGDSSDIVGNIANEPVKEISRRLRDLFFETRVENVTPCNTCDVRFLCGGKCRLENIQTSANMRMAVCNDTFRENFYRKLVDANRWSLETITT